MATPKPSPGGIDGCEAGGSEAEVAPDRARDDGRRDGPGDGAADAELLGRIAAGDRAAFAAFFARYALRVKAFLMRRGARADEADELAQEVMLTVWRKAATFDPARASASTWLFTVARNRRIDLARRQARPEPDAEDPLFQPDPEPDGADLVGRGQRDGRVREVLALLPQEQRDILLVAFYEGLSQTEIAERLGLPLGTVKSRTRLAMARLRTALGDTFREELENG